MHKKFEQHLLSITLTEWGLNVAFTATKSKQNTRVLSLSPSTTDNARQTPLSWSDPYVRVTWLPANDDDVVFSVAKFQTGKVYEWNRINQTYFRLKGQIVKNSK